MRHHYVPQFLLRPWAESAPDGKVEVFRLDPLSLRSDRHTPEHTRYEKDLWTLSRPIVAGMRKQDVEERFMKHVDNLATLVRSKLNEHGLRSLALEDMISWSVFLISLGLRQPNIVSMLHSDAVHQFRENLRAESEKFEEISCVRDQPVLENG